MTTRTLPMIRLMSPAILLTLAAVSSAAGDDRLSAILDAARTRALTPREMPPSWLDWDQLQRGTRFRQEHRREIGRCEGLLSLSESYAARDVIPILNATGALVENYGMRLRNTGRWFAAMTRRQPNLETFLEENYRRGYRLGVLHNGLVGDLASELNWNPEERIPFNQQSYAYALILFSYRPVEQLAKEKRVDFDRDRDSIEAYLHLWSVLGYGMGLDEALLPMNLEQSRELSLELRKRQLLPPREEPTTEVASLMSALLQTVIQGQQRAGVPAKEAEESTIRLVASMLESSAGLTQALGLAPDTQERLAALISEP